MVLINGPCRRHDKEAIGCVHAANGWLNQSCMCVQPTRVVLMPPLTVMAQVASAWACQMIGDLSGQTLNRLLAVAVLQLADTVMQAGLMAGEERSEVLWCCTDLCSGLDSWKKRMAAGERGGMVKTSYVSSLSKQLLVLCTPATAAAGCQLWHVAAGLYGPSVCQPWRALHLLRPVQSL